jgi:two-component system NtrC family sensor kinase
MHFMSFNDLSTMATLVGSTCIATGNLLEALVLYSLCLRIIGKTQPFDEVPAIFKFVPIAAFSALISAFVGTMITIALGLEHFPHSGIIFGTWWLGDTLAIFVMTPLLLSWWPLPRFQRDYRWLELFAASTILFVVCALLFGGYFDLTIFRSTQSLLIPILLWFAIRFSRREVVTAVAFVSVVAVIATANNAGPFISATLTASFLSEQLFSGMIAITLLVLSTVVANSAQYRQQLKETNLQLELRVALRTEELEKKSRVLEALNNQLRIEARERLSVETQLHDLKHNK